MDTNWILNRIASFGERVFLDAGLESGHVTYSQLLKKIKEQLFWIEKNNIPSGAVVVLKCDNDLWSIIMVMALMIKKVILVPVCSVQTDDIDDVISLVQANYCITPAGCIECSEGERLSHPLVEEIRERDEAGLILLSSGTTGTPKAMLLSLDRLTEKFKNQEARPAALLWFLLFDHIGGFNTLLNCLFNGGRLVPATDRSSENICTLIEKYSVSVLPTTPTFLNMLLISKAYERYNLSSIKVITYGTESMPKATLDATHRAFPYAKLKQTYGMSEIGILPTKSESDTSLWVKIGNEHVQVKVEDGVLWVKTQTAMLGYLNAPSPFNDDGWLCTGDMVRQKGEYFLILGRESSIINVGGEKVYPAEIQNVLLDVDWVEDVIVWPKKNPITGYVVAATVKCKPGLDERKAGKRLKAICRSQMASYKVPKFFEFTQEKLHTNRHKRAASPIKPISLEVNLG